MQFIISRAEFALNITLETNFKLCYNVFVRRMQMSLFVIRHGETPLNSERKFNGEVDERLSDYGFCRQQKQVCNCNKKH